MVVVEGRDVNLFIFLLKPPQVGLYTFPKGMLTKLQTHYNNCKSSEVAAVKDIF